MGKRICAIFKTRDANKKLVKKETMDIQHHNHAIGIAGSRDHLPHSIRN